MKGLLATAHQKEPESLQTEQQKKLLSLSNKCQNPATTMMGSKMPLG